MDWSYSSLPDLEKIRNSDPNTSWKPYIPVYSGYNIDCFNGSLMPFKAFQTYLSGFERVDDDPKSISLIVAVEKDIQPTVYVASHFNPDGCVLGK
eukprot:781430-Ditylum_brightwellii.AAC.1